MKQKFNLWLLSLAALVLLICNLQTMRADPEILPLLWKYEEDGLTYERICKTGKLVIMSNYKNSPVNNISFWYIIDLTNGNIIYKTNPNIENDIFINYFGDKFYVYNYIEKKWKEYYVKSKKFIRYTFGADQDKNNSAHYVSSDSVYVEFDYFSHSLLFKNLNSGILLDSFKIPNTPNQPYYSQGNDGFIFSTDGRFYSFTLQTNDKPYNKTFYLYDRVNREIIFEKKVEPYYGIYRYCFFNKSNKMAYAEEIQLPGDDTVYSYIRIFDPDQRKVVKDIKITKVMKSGPTDIIRVTGFIMSSDDKYIIHDKAQNWLYIYDLETEKKSDYSFGLYGGIIIADSSIIYSCASGVYAQIIDWTVGINYNSIIEDSILYPNPTNSIVHISKVHLQNINEIKVIDEKGTDYSKICTVSLLPDGIDLNLQKLNKGVYFIRVGNSEFSKTYKVIKC